MTVSGEIDCGIQIHDNKGGSVNFHFDDTSNLMAFEYYITFIIKIKNYWLIYENNFVRFLISNIYLTVNRSKC